jgi:hypothetical protein
MVMINGHGTRWVNGKSKGMTKREIIRGLKSGLTLVFDAWAYPDERQTLQELVDAGLIEISEAVAGDQYSYHRVTWKQSENP